MTDPQENTPRLDWSESTYIGDGVYAHHDDRGYVWLRTYRDDTPHVIALDYQTLKGVARYLFRHYPAETTNIFKPPESGNQPR